MRKWEDLPKELQTDEVRPYYNILKDKQLSLYFKRIFDVVASLVFLIILSPVFLILAICIKADSEGPVFYRQTRVTQYCREFRIHKFRSMCNGADKKGTLVTVSGDNRVTSVGKFIRKYRLDEIAQLIDVLEGNMSFVGTRAEVPKYVASYTKEMMATLLLPAGITNEACINYKDEADLLDGVKDADKIYIEEILPKKMQWNLQGVKEYSFWKELLTMIRTFLAMLGIVKPREYVENE